jgi:hypothetical protein
MTALACARSLGFGHRPDGLQARLVELRGIEPLTSAVRLHRMRPFFAVLRELWTAEMAFWIES